jgi:capsular polysaccharide biosynthesis protein
MENQIENNQNLDEEISLIDLFAVLVRYRKLIIIGTLVVTFLAGLYLFVVPVVLPNLSNAKETLSYTIVVDELPSSLDSEFFRSNTKQGLIMGLAMEELQNLSTFSAVYKENPIFSTDDSMPETPSQYNLMIQKLFGSDIKILPSEVGNTIKITVEIPAMNAEKSDDFIAKYITTVNNSLDSFILPRLKNIQTSTETALKAMEGQNSIMNSSQDLQVKLFDITPYLTGKSSFLHIQGEPFVLPVAQGRLMKLIIVAFAAFFVTVFWAFVLNAINNIKADPQASKVLSEAWKAGK